VTNTTDNEQTFDIAKEDVAGNRSDPNANPVLLGGKVSSPISGYDWLSGAPSSVSVGPGDSRSFTVNVEAPAGAKGGHYAALTVTSRARDIGDVHVQSRAAVLFMINAGGVAPPEIVVEDVVVTKDGGTVIDYVNEGNTEVRPEGTITYRDAITGKVVSVRRAKECTVALPGGIGRCEFEALGKEAVDNTLALRPTIKLANEGRSTTAELPLEWSGTWSSMILPLAGIGMLFLFLLRRRRREEEEDADLLTP
jgi:hypothetical protein